MPSGQASLIAGRSAKPLNDDDVRKVTNTILGLDEEVPFRHVPGERTRCRVYTEGDEELCEVAFGADIFPGTSVLDPNSSLSMRAAVAHELSHYHRWRDKTELIGDELMHLDEALTSLDAARRYALKLYPQEVLQLVADAMQRLILYHQSLTGEDALAADDGQIPLVEDPVADEQSDAAPDQ